MFNTTILFIVALLAMSVVSVEENTSVTGYSPSVKDELLDCEKNSHTYLVNLNATRQALKDLSNLYDNKRWELAEKNSKIKDLGLEIDLLTQQFISTQWWCNAAIICASISTSLIVSYAIQTFCARLNRWLANVFTGICASIAARLGFVVRPVRPKQQKREEEEDQQPTPEEQSKPKPSKRFTPEAYVRGSEYITTEEIPSCQFFVYADDEDSTFIGNGIWLKDWLIMPSHVLDAVKRLADRVAIVTARKEGDKIAYVHVDDFDYAGNEDLVYTTYSQSLYSCLQLSKANVPVIKYEVKGLPAVIAANGYKTYGNLQTPPDSVTTYKYQGSTKVGFSGAAYMWGKNALAMHLGSYDFGVGLRLDYAASLITKHVTMRKESLDSETFLEIVESISRDISRGEKIKFNSTGPDEITFFYKGKYHFFEEGDEAYKMLIDHGTLERRDLKGFEEEAVSMQNQYADIPETPKATKNEASPPVVEADGKKEIVPEVVMNPSWFERLEQKLLRLETRVGKVSAGLQSTRAQREGPSQYTRRGTSIPGKAARQKTSVARR